MNSNPLIDRVQVAVFGDCAGARYRAGRTVRILRQRFSRVVDASVLNAADFAQLVGSSDSPVWFVRAGALPHALADWFLPPRGSNGRGLCAFGLVRCFAAAKTLRSEALLSAVLRPEMARLARDAAAWSELQAASGGDFSRVGRFDEMCPRIASALLDEALCRDVAKRVANGIDFDSAVRAQLAASNPRCVRLPHLDVFDDPALRVAQAVTSLQRGGAERVTLDLTRELPRYGVRTLLFALGSPTRAAFETPDEFVEFFPGRNRAEHLRNFAQRAIALGCDAVHAHLLSASDMGLVAVSGLPVVATIHNCKQGWPAGFVQAPVPQTSRLPVSLMVACSQAVERDVIGADFGVPVRTIWNGIDAAAFQSTPEIKAAAGELRAKLEFEPDDFVLLSLANPRPQKRLDRLPAILAALRNELETRGVSRGVKLVVAGEAARLSDDAQRCDAALRTEIARLNLGDAVRFVGAAEDVATLLHASDALVSVSAWEGLSLAHLEALAAGTPVVATDAGGTVEIARENPGVSVMPLDAAPETLAAKLADIAEKQVARDESSQGDANDARKRSSFLLNIMAERYASLFPRAIEFSRGARRGEGVWLIANNFSTGGAQSSARRLLLGFHARGISVRAAVLQEREDNLTPGLSALRGAGVPVFIPEMRSADPLDAVIQILERIDADPPRAILFWNAIAEHKVLLADAIWDIPIYDVSPGEMYFDSLDAYFARPRPGLPYKTPAEYGARLAGIVVKFQGETARARASLELEARVIPNGLPIERAIPSCRHESHIFVIGTSARLSPQKKLEELLAAVRLAAPRLPPYMVRIAGRPETGATAYAARLVALSADLCVEWCGEFQDSAAFLASLDVFAMISEPAGCPNASLEAMAAKLPVVATDYGGASEQIEDGVTGRLVPRGDAGAFADALVELARDAEKRAAFGIAGRARVEARFGLERMVEDYRRLCGV